MSWNIDIGAKQRDKINHGIPTKAMYHWDDVRHFGINPYCEWRLDPGSLFILSSEIRNSSTIFWLVNQLNALVSALSTFLCHVVWLDKHERFNALKILHPCKKDLIFLQLKVLERKFFMKQVYQYMAIFCNFHPLQIIFNHYKSRIAVNLRLVVDEDYFTKFSLESVKSYSCLSRGKSCGIKKKWIDDTQTNLVFYYEWKSCSACHMMKPLFCCYLN